MLLRLYVWFNVLVGQHTKNVMPMNFIYVHFK